MSFFEVGKLYRVKKTSGWHKDWIGRVGRIIRVQEYLNDPAGHFGVATWKPINSITGRENPILSLTTEAISAMEELSEEESIQYLLMG